MWSSVLVLALLAGLDPMRLGWTLLMVSRPRPLQNLVAFWAGSMIAGVTCVVVPLTLLHVTPMFKSFAHDYQHWALSSSGKHLVLGMGVLTLSIAALMIVRSLTRRRQRAHLPAPVGNTSTLVLDSNTPTAISPPGRAQDAVTEGESVIRRLLRRAHNAYRTAVVGGWENGSLWVGWVMGIGCVPPIEFIVFILAMAAASGASIGTQLSAAIVFVVGTLSVVEIMLVSHLARPAKTEVVLQLLHGWALAHRRQVLVAMFAVAGVSLVARGAGIV